MRRLPLYAVGFTALAVVAGCSSSSTPSASPSPPAAAQQDAVIGNISIAAQPNDQGQTLINTINGATTSVDIPIYQIGDPNIQNALVAAMQKGVTVRVMADGGTSGNVKKNEPFAKSLTEAAQAAGVAPEKLQLHWSSNNFSLTHQKSVIVDALDSSGAPLAAGAMPPTARLMVSTGNFYSSTYKGVTSEYYAPRDYYITVDDQNLIAAAEKVFSSDFSCAGRTVTNDLRDAKGLVWSNGTTGYWTTDAAGEYPAASEGYFNTSLTKNSYPPAEDQGNSAGTLVALLASVKPGDVVRVSNEELNADNKVAGQIVQAIGDAAKAGADVRVVMSYGNADDATLEGLAKAGAKVTLFAPQQMGVAPYTPLYPDALYIHAKLITVQHQDGTAQGFVGSENISTGSLTWNRELGLALDQSDGDALGQLNAVFDTDFNTTGQYTTQLTKENPNNIPAGWEQFWGPTTSPSPSPTAAELETLVGSQLGASDSDLPRVSAPAGVCGPIPVS